MDFDATLQELKKTQQQLLEIQKAYLLQQRELNVLQMEKLEFLLSQQKDEDK